MLIGPQRAAFAALFLLATTAAAQAPIQDADLPDAPSASQSAAAATAQPPTSAPSIESIPCAARALRQSNMSTAQMKSEESQYIGAVIPNFNTVFGDCAPKLSAKEKWVLVYHSAVVPFTIGLDALVAGGDEITGAHNGYGWGPSGYFKRFGAEYADTVDAAVLGNGLLPVLLHQDPRYFQMGPGHSFFRRVVHAAASDIICLSDSGHRQFFVSNVLGNLLAGAISNAYYPADERGVGLTFKSYLTVSLEGSLGSQLLEFSPDITAFFQRKFHKNPAP